jgi:hypothetical protein
VFDRRFWLTLGAGAIVSAFACATSDRSSGESASRSDGRAAPPTAVDTGLGAGPAGAVRQFLAWYVPLATAPGSGPAWHSALTLAPPALTEGLLRALRADSIAWAASPGDIVGIDFDPFLATQDPCDSYHTGAALDSGALARVPVYSGCPNLDGDSLAAVLQVMRFRSRWLIRNVEYPRESTDLISVLQALHPT